MSIPVNNQLNQLAVGFIGAGNMASAIVQGLIKSGHLPSQICLSNPSGEKLQFLQQSFGVKTTHDNQALLDLSDIIVLAVKPQKMQAALAGLTFAPHHCVISVAAGLTTSKLSEWIRDQAPIIRSMPNTPAIELCGATGIYAAAEVKRVFEKVTNYIFGSIGRYVWIEEESQMDAVTALAGSSPAYFFRIMELMIAAGIRQGLPESSARLLVEQSALGAATLICRHPEIPIRQRREQVTSPNGTTAAALASFEANHLPRIIDQAIDASVKRGQELAKS